jgi:predicted dehydrogenase
MDLFRFLVGDPARIQAVAGNVMQKLLIEDFGMIHFLTDGRAFGEITASYSLKGCGNFVEWYGTKGMAVISYWNEGFPDLKYRVDGNPKWVTVDCSRHPDRFVGEIRHFLDCIRSGRKPSMTAEDGLKANRIAKAIYRSVKEKKQVAVRL